MYSISAFVFTSALFSLQGVSTATYSTDVHIGETEGEGWRQPVATLAWTEDAAPSSGQCWSRIGEYVSGSAQLRTWRSWRTSLSISDEENIFRQILAFKSTRKVISAFKWETIVNIRYRWYRWYTTTQRRDSPWPPRWLTTAASNQNQKVLFVSDSCVLRQPGPGPRPAL